MDSTQSDRSLSGISLPQWMKSKISDRYDLEQTAFSPPNEDDSFFFVRYPKAKSLEPASTAATASVSQKGQINYLALGEVLQNHTVPCRQFIPEAKTTPHELGLRKADPPLGRLKSTGTDDGFTGEGAACGHSVVAVAHQMISGKLLTGSADEHKSKPPQRRRRNSRSLPASPQGSPRLIKKNPFFTSPLLGSNEMLQKTDIKYGSGPVAACDSQNKQGWLVSIVSRNASKEELFSGTDDLPIIPDLEESLDLLNINKPKVPSSTYKAKPSELREMNFWSPTSM
ncbi:hypothetical protein LSTR_LSTR007354 [Laodelphax striatellus]|uniref:Uncharacterized protein n=1 Tax=Laodelphax striatellus TaxID=195883 RepID=A0A482XNT3_LAOST|nr:hypothetical protein LSTR_LSTR007354 [Laodelphax striatellus]